MDSLNSSSIFGGDMHKEEEDETLNRLRTAIDPIMTEVEEQETTAIMVIGAHALPDESNQIQTFIDVVGDYSILQEALYTELLDQIEKGNSDLFLSLREVINAIEEEIGLEPGEPIEEKRTLH